MKKAIVLFGGTGDLSYRKLYPAIYNLYTLSKIGGEYTIIGIGRRDFSQEEYIKIVKEKLQEFAGAKYQEKKFEEFSQHIRYYKMNFNHEEEYKNLAWYFAKENMSKEILYYYAVSPEYFTVITGGLKKYQKDFGAAKIIIEKPFGKDLPSAKELNRELSEDLEPDHIYYIDHYLGKEMLLNIMTIRFFNAMFKGIWNRDYIDNIQIHVSEKVGVETRGGYYDKAGAVADMMQNHLLQILSVVAMDEPEKFDTKGIKEAQMEVFRHLKPIPEKEIKNHMVLGQYKGYRQEDKVARDSQTETYAAMKIEVENDRWKGVPFYLRTGKRLDKREIEVILQFKPTKHSVDMMQNQFVLGDLQNIAENNILVIKIQPEEGIQLDFNIKKPGAEDAVDTAKLEYCQSCNVLNSINTPEAYERLIEACIHSNTGLFSKWEQIELSWEYMNRVVKAYKENQGGLYEYEQGSKGPQEAQRLLSRDGRKWIEG